MSDFLLIHNLVEFRLKMRITKPYGSGIAETEMMFDVLLIYNMFEFQIKSININPDGKGIA